MRKISFTILMLMLLAVPAHADNFNALLDEADALFEKAHHNVVDPGTAAAYMRSYQLSVKAAQINPNSYEANFKALRGARMYCWILKNHLVPGYQKECTRMSKEGLRYGLKAIELAPNKPDGYFWYASCLASYADGVSILTAAKEGLKGKTQKAFETAYRLDPDYWQNCGALALGEFWYVLPWPMNDKPKARKLLEQYVKLIKPGDDNVEEGQYQLGRLLFESNNKSDQARGRELLLKASKGRYPYYRKLAGEALAKG